MTTAEEDDAAFPRLASFTLLRPDGPAQVSVAAGSVFVVPRGLWRRQLARPSATLLAAVPPERERQESAVSW